MRRHVTKDPHRRLVLETRARQMRAFPTNSEALLWRAIRGRQLGVHFRRQMPIGRFIVDFVATEARLVVEVDGGCHQRQQHADARRDAKLRRAGYRVLRLDAELVRRELPLALARIQAALRA